MHKFFEPANPANEFRSISTIKESEHCELDQQAGVYIQSPHTVTWKAKCQTNIVETQCPVGKNNMEQHE